MSSCALRLCVRCGTSNQTKKEPDNDLDLHYGNSRKDVALKNNLRLLNRIAQVLEINKIIENNTKYSVMLDQ